MKNRFGIDWDAIIRKEIVSRMIAAPYFEEASSLLFSAAELWIGPLGAGRLRAKELRGLAQEIREAGRHWRECALGWSPPPDWEGFHGCLLRDYRDRRGFRTRHEIEQARCHDRSGDPPPLPKYPAAANRLVLAAARLVEEQLSVIAVTGDHLYRRETVQRWEDCLERIGELPAAVTDLSPAPQAAIDRLGRRALCRTCEGIFGSVAVIWCGAKCLPEPQRKERYDLWLARSRRFGAEAVRLYEDFAGTVAPGSAGTRQAILASMDAQDPECWPSDWHHYEGVRETEQVSALAEALVAVLMTLAAERYGRSAADFCRSELGSGSDRPALPDADASSRGLRK